MANKTEKREFIFLKDEYETLVGTKELYKTLFEGEELEEMLEDINEEIEELWENETMFNLELED